MHRCLNYTMSEMLSCWQHGYVKISGRFPNPYRARTRGRQAWYSTRSLAALRAPWAGAGILSRWLWAGKIRTRVMTGSWLHIRSPIPSLIFLPSYARPGRSNRIRPCFSLVWTSLLVSRKSYVISDIVSTWSARQERPFVSEVCITGAQVWMQHLKCVAPISISLIYAFAYCFLFPKWNAVQAFDLPLSTDWHL